MVDRSMTMDANGSFNWNYAMATISAFAEDPASSGMDVGFAVFPASSDKKADCMAGKDCGAPVVALTRLPAASQVFVNALMAETPPSQPPLPRPTECALRGMINYCEQAIASSMSGERCFGVLITQGGPTQCDMNESDLEMILANGHSKGVDTFVIGEVGADMQVLNRYATAGGTGSAIDASSGPTAFLQALTTIRDRVAR